MVKNLLANAAGVRDVGSVLGLGRSPGGGHGDLLQYSCLENGHGQRAWWAIVHRVTKSQTQLSTEQQRDCLAPHIPLILEGVFTVVFLSVSYYGILGMCRQITCLFIS